MRQFGLLCLALFLVTACGSKSSSEDPAPAAPTYAQVTEIVSGSCATTSGCHLNGANVSTQCGDFTASETKYKAAQACATAANTPAARVQLASTDGKYMPQGSTLKASQISTLVNFK